MNSVVMESFIVHQERSLKRIFLMEELTMARSRFCILTESSMKAISKTAKGMDEGSITLRMATSTKVSFYMTKEWARER